MMLQLWDRVERAGAIWVVTGIGAERISIIRAGVVEVVDPATTTLVERRRPVESAPTGRG